MGPFRVQSEQNSLLTVSNRTQSSWCLFGSWMNFQWSCLAFSVSNFCLHSGHWKLPVILIPTLSTEPSPLFAASVISMASGIVFVVSRNLGTEYQEDQSSSRGW